MANIQTNLQRIQNVHSDMSNSVTNKFGYSFSSGNGFEQIADKLGDISTDINTQLTALLGNFTATINATVTTGANVTATSSLSTATATSTSGAASLVVGARGTYSVSATISNGNGNPVGNSNVQSVEIKHKSI